MQNQVGPLEEVPLDGRDIKGSLDRLVAAARQRYGAPLEAFIDDGVGEGLSPGQAEHILQLVREAISNAVLHAGASRMVLRAGAENQRLVIRLSDDGAGFHVVVSDLLQGGFAAMQQRAEAIGGLLQVESAPDAGTIITLTLGLCRSRRGA